MPAQPEGTQVDGLQAPARLAQGFPAQRGGERPWKQLGEEGEHGGAPGRGRGGWAWDRHGGVLAVKPQDSFSSHGGPNDGKPAIPPCEPPPSSQRAGPQLEGPMSAERARPRCRARSARRPAGVGLAGDRTPHDEVVGARQNGGAGRGDACLIAGGVAGEANAGRDGWRSPGQPRCAPAVPRRRRRRCRRNRRRGQRRARRVTRASERPANPVRLRSAAVRLVSTVTARTLREVPLLPATAARRVLRSWPCTVRNVAPVAA